MKRGDALRGAVIGCGFVAQHHLASWLRFPRSVAELAAICDTRPDRLEWAGGVVPSARRYASARDLFEREELDFVEICTRPAAHRELTELAAANGVHVLCQKPAAETREDLRAMIDACARAKVRLMIHENWRFRPWNRALKAELQNGRIGRPIRLRLAHRDLRALMADGFADQPYFAEMPRLILFEMGPHLVDTARYLMGEVAAVSAIVGRFGHGHAGDDVATLTLWFRSGAVGLLDMTWCAHADVARPDWALNETVAEGTAGSLRVEADGSMTWRGPHNREQRIPVALPPAEEVYIEGYAATQRHFLHGLLDGSAHETSGVETLKTMDVVWGGYGSAEERRVIDLE